MTRRKASAWATCHPDRPRIALDLCRQCYRAAVVAESTKRPGASAKALGRVGFTSGRLGEPVHLETAIADRCAHCGGPLWGNGLERRCFLCGRHAVVVATLEVGPMAVDTSGSSG